MEEYLSGLSTPEVLERRERGEGGNATEQITKTRSQIVRENLFTLFNFLNFLIAALLFAVGAYSNMLFIAIIILNIVIGIAQELKAKKLMDELSILNRPTVTVRRDGEEMTVGIEEIVKDDLVVLTSGSQICNDAVVMSGVLEVNESLLTGESDAVVKEEGAELLSGSSVISGKAYARVTHVGDENYATRLANEVTGKRDEMTGAEEKKGKTEQIVVGDVVIEPRTWKVWKKDRELKLPNREFELLRFLAENPNIVFSKEELFEKIWGYDYISDAATVSVHINRLREKNEDDARNPKIIETVWGAGYRLNA